MTRGLLRDGGLTGRSDRLQPLDRTAPTHLISERDSLSLHDSLIPANPPLPLTLHPHFCQDSGYCGEDDDYCYVGSGDLGGGQKAGSSGG